MLGSLLLALTFVPAVSAWLLQAVPRSAERAGWIDCGTARTALVLDAGARHAASVVAVAVALVVAPSPRWRVIGTEFMPKLDEGSILINTRRLPSVALDDATRMSHGGGEDRQEVP